MTITAHADQCIRFFDSRQDGGCCDSMKAHREAVTGLSIDPLRPMYMASCSTYGIRFWDLKEKKLVQDLDPTHSHRKKLEEGVLSVQYHPSLPCLASSGADALIKVYV